MVQFLGRRTVDVYFETAPWLEKSGYEKLLPWNCDPEQVNRYDYNGLQN